MQLVEFFNCFLIFVIIQEFELIRLHSKDTLKEYFSKNSQRKYQKPKIQSFRISEQLERHEKTDHHCTTSQKLKIAVYHIIVNMLFTPANNYLCHIYLHTWGDFHNSQAETKKPYSWTTLVSSHWDHMLVKDIICIRCKASLDGDVTTK